MLPKSVLHKRNGHRQPPPAGAPSTGQILGLVHRDPDRALELSPDLVRFAAIIQSERPTDLWEQIVTEGMSLPSALAKALTRTREAFQRGELSDLRLALEGLQAQAEAAARIVARLTGLSEPKNAERSLASLNDLALRALGPVMATASVSRRLDPGLPLIAADPGQMHDVLTILFRAVGRTREAAGRSGALTVETTHGDGVLSGERVVRLLVTDDYGQGVDRLRPVPVLSVQHSETPAAGTGADLRRAARLVKEHGGVLCSAPLPGGGICFTLDLPVV
jgi:signal transduction histidine kinase